jgi:hypothetical protein
MDASEYFMRHMRILEYYISARQPTEVQRHVDALREAFSVDTSKPFMLKPNFRSHTLFSNHHPAGISGTGTSGSASDPLSFITIGAPNFNSHNIRR